MSHRGKLIVIDGIDGAGKTTQADALVERLNAEGYPAGRMKFPRYETFLGQTIRQYLRGELGSAHDQSPYLVSLLFAADRWAAKAALEAELAAGRSVVLDRYVMSNRCFQAARLPAKQRPHLRAWLDELEYTVFDLQKADCFIYLDIPVAHSDQLIAKRGGEREAYEADRKLVARVAKEYAAYCATDPLAHRIQSSRKGKLLTIPVIHETIWGVVAPMLAHRSEASNE